MTYLYLGLNWAFGALFLVLGLVALFETVLGGLCLFVIAALLLPPVRSFVHSKTNTDVSFKVRAVLVVVFLGIFGHFVGEAEKKKAMEVAEQNRKAAVQKQAQLKQQNKDYFAANRAQIISSTQASLSAGNFQAVAATYNKYGVAGDAELAQIYGAAKGHIDEMNRVAAEKAQAEAEKKAAAESRKKRIEAQFSQWDGSHRKFERMIKDSMHNPQSYEHVETRYWDLGDHLTVKTTFRGTNGFGGVVKSTSMAKVDLDGNVIKVLE